MGRGRRGRRSWISDGGGRQYGTPCGYWRGEEGKKGKKRKKKEKEKKETGQVDCDKVR